MRVIFAVALSCCAVLFANGNVNNKRIGVARPKNSGRLDDKDIDTIWMTLETEARKAADSSGLYKVIDRGNFNELQASAGLKREVAPSEGGERLQIVDQTTVSYILSSSVGALTGGKYVLNMTLIDCASGENVSGSSQSKTFVSLGELIDELEPMVSRCIKCVCTPPLVAVLKTVVLNPSIPQLYGELFQKTLSYSLMRSKVRLALSNDIELKLRKNGIDSMQSLTPLQYTSVSKLLKVNYLIISQLTTCELHLTNVDNYLQQRRSKFQAGTIAGCIMAVDMQGEIKVLIPFETTFNFNEMIAKGEMDCSGWDANQYCSQMIRLAVAQNLQELLNRLN